MSRDEKIEPRAEFAVMERSRATPVRPAIWMTGVLAWATVIALLFRVPTWAGIFLCGLTGLSFLLYLVSYSYLLLNDREALRRERLRVKGSQARDIDSFVSSSSDLVNDQLQLAAVKTHPLVGEQAGVIRRDDT